MITFISMQDGGSPIKNCFFSPTESTGLVRAQNFFLQNNVIVAGIEPREAKPIQWIYFLLILECWIEGILNTEFPLKKKSRADSALQKTRAVQMRSEKPLSPSTLLVHPETGFFRTRFTALLDLCAFFFSTTRNFFFLLSASHTLSFSLYLLLPPSLPFAAVS